MVRSLAIFSGVLLLTGAGFSQSKGPGGSRTEISAETMAMLEAHEGLVYATYGGREMKLDLYRPKNTEGDLPAVVCIHGGGWWQGTRANHAHVAKALAARGYVTATISYRLSDEAPFPAQIQDCKAAVRFLRAKAEKFGIISDRIGAIGLSAGGHLTALLGTSGEVKALEGDGGNADQSGAIQAAVPVGAQSDFRPHYENIENSNPNPPGPKPNIWVQFLRGKPSEAPDNWKMASPLTHLDASDPPMLFITGENDKETTHAEKFRGEMKELGIDEGLHVIPGAPHAFPGRQDWFDDMLEHAADWFDVHLKG